MVELASAVVGNIDPFDAVIERDGCILGGGDALDDQRDLVLVLDQFHGAPLQPFLEVAAGGAHAACADVALGYVAFAPAVMGGVDRQAERGISVRDGTADAILYEGVAAAHIELKHAQRVRRGLGDFLKARFGHRTQHMGGAEAAGSARDAGAGIRIEHLERADWRQHDRQSQLAAEHLDRSVDFGDIAQYARTESDLVQRHAVATHRGFGLGGPDNVVPLILVEVRARLMDELVKVLELFAARAEFNGRWRDGVASFMVSSRVLGLLSRCLSGIVSGAFRQGTAHRGWVATIWDSHLAGAAERVYRRVNRRDCRPGPVRSRMRKPAMSEMLLFSPLAIRGIELRNRIVVPPMHQYSAVKGFPTDWHLMNAGKFAAGGAGLVVVESTKVERRGCGTLGDLGIWDDVFVEPLKRVVKFIKQQNSAAGIQLGHSGRKARARRPWEGDGPLQRTPEIDDWDAWTPVAPSAIAHSEKWPVPKALAAERNKGSRAGLGQCGAARR